MSDAPRSVPSEAAPAAGRIEIRPIRREEVPAVWALMRGLAEYEKLLDLHTGTPALLESALFGDGLRIEGRVAADGERLLGYMLFYPVFGSFRGLWRLWLEDLFVAPEARGLGVGERLMAELARLATERGFASVDWEVLDWNELALGFYRAKGARDMGGGWLHYRLDGEAMAKLAGEGSGSAR